MLLSKLAKFIMIAQESVIRSQHPGRPPIGDYPVNLPQPQNWFNAIFLEVRESNQVARSLYRKAGFEETGARKSYYS
ncbi:MAG: hypothetical protein WAU92_00915, partial [Candidatus Sulfotelmatobacter sp.]